MKKSLFYHYRKENRQKPFINYVYGNLTLVWTRALISTRQVWIVFWCNGQFIIRVSNFCQIINRVGNNADLGHKWGKGFGKWAAHPHPIIVGVAPRVERLLHGKYAGLRIATSFPGSFPWLGKRPWERGCPDRAFRVQALAGGTLCCVL